MNNNITDEFSKLTTKFLFNNSESENCKHELNNILNELNSLDYSSKNVVDQKAVNRLFESFTRIPTSEDTLIVKICCLVTILLNRQKVSLEPTQFRNIIEWQRKCLNHNFESVACDVLSSMQAMFKHHPKYCRENWVGLLSLDGNLMKIFAYLEQNSPPKETSYDTNSREDIAISCIYCIESLLIPLDSVDMEDEMIDLLAEIGSKVLRVLYSERIQFNNSVHHMNFIINSINIINKIVAVNQDWTENNIGELLGLSKAFMLYGLPGIPQFKLQKVHISQQSVVEPNVSQENKRGKMAKTRKPRTVNKNKKVDARNKSAKSATEQTASGGKLQIDFDNPFVTHFNKTSDSDFSESEASRARSERHRQSKLRLTALSLVGLVAKITEKRILYGYLHSLFPSEPLSPAQSTLLNCIVRDPNPRCRIAALQASSVLLLGSKAFLSQGENSEKHQTSFIPFSITLGNMILSIYEALTQALSTESSLPVLTQILKCLSVLIQATPFHRLKSGFVPNFVRFIIQLIEHKDPTIQVGALMVMEFLISVQEMTKEISDVVGIPKSAKNVGKNWTANRNLLDDSGANEILESFDSDYEDDNVDDAKNPPVLDPKPNIPMSWLLRRVLENLGVIVNGTKPTSSPPATPVRVESLQVLTAMSAHFLLLKDHLLLISTALKNSLDDVQADIRLYTAKCFDALGHAINTFLLENGTPSVEDLTLCQQFWTAVMPSVIAKIQDHETSASVKSILCDFMSNIGVHIFERLPHSSQMQLISLLSGVSYNEENLVRAAAVRALAVYVQFPSLRGDLCFVENTAESVIQLVKDSNLFVRVKASWALGNVSDALITSYCLNSQPDSISNNLLQRLVEVAIESSGDNDKVRCNAVRTLGNLLRLVTSEHLETASWRRLSLKAIEKLIVCVNTGNNAKVKWNGCYAIGNFMKNTELFTSYSDLNWQVLVFPALCNLIIYNTNFKVRINGTAALMTIQDRHYYGTHLQLVWTSLLSAMEQSDNLIDFNEYKHRDNLQEQLCFALSHIVKIVTREDDYIVLKNELVPKLETIRASWIRVSNRVLPENAAPLLACSAKLKELAASRDLTAEQRISVQVLASCFVEASADAF